MFPREIGLRRSLCTNSRDFNRYISSALKSLPDGYFDEYTGFVKSPDVVIQLACQFQACASNKVAKGIALSNLKVPGHEDSEKNVRV